MVVQKNINPYLHLQKIICWAKEDRLTKKWEAQKKKNGKKEDRKKQCKTVKCYYAQ